MQPLMTTNRKSSLLMVICTVLRSDVSVFVYRCLTGHTSSAAEEVVVEGEAVEDVGGRRWRGR